MIYSAFSEKTSRKKYKQSDVFYFDDKQLITLKGPDRVFAFDTIMSGYTLKGTNIIERKLQQMG
jgi:hypothetical protein